MLVHDCVRWPVLLHPRMDGGAYNMAGDQLSGTVIAKITDSYVLPTPEA